ncbi:MAG TPA: LysR family transcriptional regulator [Nocardioidaceae bacterium]|jgi:DNA-binding transcriptional LysR family regulator|nr:LysR family transcriptional regulator [Nocardioidaceae bacterium]
MEFRDLEIFLTLAEELHFGRTAERLHVSQARVSQAIKKQERRIGAPLFWRTSRRVELTPIGRRLRSQIQEGYDLIQHGLSEAANEAQRLRGTIHLGAMGATGNHLRAVVEAFEADHPACAVEPVEFHFSDPFTPLRAGTTDLQLMWLPVREPDLATSPVLITEGRVLAVSTQDPLTARQNASLEDLGDRLVPDPGALAPEYWIETMVPHRTPGGRLVRRGRTVRTFHEILTLVAAGELVCPLNAHVSSYYSHPDIALLPLTDAPPTEWALVSRAAQRNRLVDAFTATAARFCQPGRTLSAPSAQ